MGPNRQRRPQNGPRSRHSGHHTTPAPPPSVPPSMLTNAGRDLVIDVLQHAASGGSVPVPERHFDAVGTRITLQRNAPRAPSEVLQRLYEALGFPRDLVTQFITDMISEDRLPSFDKVTDLLREDGAHQHFLVQCCFDLFSAMVLYARDSTAESAASTAPLHGNDEETEQILRDEMDAVQELFSDVFVGERQEGGQCELYFAFRTHDISERTILIAIRTPEGYPRRPPMIHIQPGKAASDGGLPILTVAPYCTRDIPAAARRAILDAAAATISSLANTVCLMALLSAIGGTISELVLDSTVATPAPQEQAHTEQQQRQQRVMGEQRKAFVQALLGSADKVSAKAEGPRLDPGTVIEDADPGLSCRLPAKVELATVTAPRTMGERARTEFLRRDTLLDDALRVAWAKLSREGSLSEQRRQLPAYRIRDALRQTLAEHNVVVIGGETGSGKTTQIPQYIFEMMCEEGRGSSANILCTQPRRLAATSVALRVAEERDEAVGGTVGYTIRLESCSSRRTQILYCTTGIVLRRLQTDKFLGSVSHIVVDEIHERGIDTDFLLILLRDLLQARTDLKVVLMSATMNTTLFARYFGGAPVLTIEGRTFPVKVMHLEQIIPAIHYVLEDGSPYARRTSAPEPPRRNARKQNLGLFYGVAEAIDDENTSEWGGLTGSAKASIDTDEPAHGESPTGAITPRTRHTIARMDLRVVNYELIEGVVLYIDGTLRIDGAVLIFLPGMSEIQRCLEQLRSNSTLARTCVFHNLHSSLGSAEQREVFRRPPAGRRKVIIGTNIMETSITVDDAVFVIDTGLARENRYNPRKHLSELVTVTISKANCRQRQGRAGRVRDGFCFRLFTEAQYMAMAEHQLCEMHRVPLESLILQIYALHLGDEVAYLQKALTPPEERAITGSVQTLTTLGALTAQKRLTSLGQHLAGLPLDVRIGKMLIHGALLRCLDPILTIATCLTVRSPFISAPDLRSEVEGVRRAFSADSHSDQLASWFAYSQWVSALLQESAAAARTVCNDCYLSWVALMQIQSTKRQYEKYLCESGFIDANQGARQSSHKFLFAPYVTLDNRVFEAGGEYYNANSASTRCILACLVAGLYPNIARVKPRTGRGRQREYGGGGGGAPLHLITLDGSDCLIHPSSVAGRLTQLPSQLLVYVDKVKTSATFLRDVSLVTPLHVILFGSGDLHYLERYSELCVDDRTAFRCTKEDASLLLHLKGQLDSALTMKINDPAASWEAVSSVVIRAIVKLLTGNNTHGGGLVIVDRAQPRPLLTSPLVPENAGSTPSPLATAAATVGQPFVTGKSCYVCGEAGHVAQYCPHTAARNSGGPSVRCFICGQWHYPLDCPLALPT